MYEKLLMLLLLFAFSLSATQTPPPAEGFWRIPEHNRGAGDTRAPAQALQVGFVSPDPDGAITTEAVAGIDWVGSEDEDQPPEIRVEASIHEAYPERIRDLDMPPPSRHNRFTPLQADFSPELALLAALFGFGIGVAILGGAEKMRGTPRRR